LTNLVSIALALLDANRRLGKSIAPANHLASVPGGFEGRGAGQNGWSLDADVAGGGDRIARSPGR